ncbi:MAG: copper amine oxidase N-terminal domain-containing protein [Actinobacteria bacterium]|nr:copper amine oxidase N-terminal domain-containing protein [Actinomycetota bacterium]
MNGREVKTDVLPQVIDGRTLVPVRFIAEALGADVKWDEATGTVNILFNKIPSPVLQPQREEIFSWEAGHG